MSRCTARNAKVSLAHVCRPQIFTWSSSYVVLLKPVSSFLQIFVWSKEYQENWSAFAPDFKVRTHQKPKLVHNDRITIASVKLFGVAVVLQHAQRSPSRSASQPRAFHSGSMPPAHM